jgi:hypothetical protein
MFNRQHFFASYLQKFSKDYEKSLEGFLPDEQVHITDTLLALLECYKQNPIDYKQVQKIHDKLFKKYRKRLNNYNNMAPSGYFEEESMKHLDLQYDLDVEHKGEGENFFTEQERKNFLTRAEILLKNHKRMLYLQTEPSAEGEEKDGMNGGKDKTNNKFKRERGDNATKLTEEQTALLAYLLSRTKITLKLGKEYGSIENKTAGEAFSMLTGFNPDNLRQSLGKEKLKQVASKKNLDAVSNALQQTINYIDQFQKSLKEPKSTS